MSIICITSVYNLYQNVNLKMDFVDYRIDHNKYKLQSIVIDLIVKKGH